MEPEELPGGAGGDPAEAAGQLALQLPGHQAEGQLGLSERLRYETNNAITVRLSD